MTDRSGGLEEWLTVPEVAAALKYTTKTIRQWIEQGTLPAVTFGARDYRISRADLDAKIAELRTRGNRGARNVEDESFLNNITIPDDDA